MATKTVQEKIDTLKAIAWYIKSEEGNLEHGLAYYIDRFNAREYLLTYLLDDTDAGLLALLSEAGIELNQSQLDSIIEAWNLENNTSL